jgi:hypothetical protein
MRQVMIDKVDRSPRPAEGSGEIERASSMTLALRKADE